MKTILFLAGTRPEFIKIHSVIKKLNQEKKVKIILVSSNQQNKILGKYIDGLKINHYLKITEYKTDIDFLSKFFINLDKYLQKKNVNYILVQGDTSTAYGGALYGFLNKIPVIHLEAGLRTYDLDSPWPEEFYRQNIARMSKIHLSQSFSSKNNLYKENIKENVYVVGNPGIDYFVEQLKLLQIRNKKEDEKKRIVVTMHRRENIENNIQKFIDNLILFSNKNKNYEFIWPVHSNIKIKKIITNNKYKLDKLNLILLEPLRYKEFLKYLINADLIITDSGGIQEEAAYLGKPLLIARDKTERVDIIRLGLGKIIHADARLLEEGIKYFKNKNLTNKKINEWRKIQGFGKSAEKICETLDIVLFKKHK